MKVLFICSRDVYGTSNGGELCTNRNYLSLCELVGVENVQVENLMNNLGSRILNAIIKRFNYLQGFNEGLTLSKLNYLVELAAQSEMVFIDSSIYGILAKKLKLKCPQTKIITFFHNVEVIIKKQKAKNHPSMFMEVIVTRRNEKLACQYSDHIITVNTRDKYELSRIYKIGNVTIIPISLKDTLRMPKSSKISIPPTYIFTGNNWYANIHGINWFIEHVLDHVNIKLQITGHRMEELEDKYTHSKVDFLGFVDDLGEVLAEADYVVSPIFIGSGMKVKTCEALMYGKNILGTKESFEGYDIDPNMVGASCESADDFIQAINDFEAKKMNKFNESSRAYFLGSYSFDATLSHFSNLLD